MEGARSEHRQPTAMGALIEAHDWSGTALGPASRWPDALQAAVALCLGADFPVAVWWGRNLVQLYNEPFRRAIGARRHRSGFAAPLAQGWPDLWPRLEPAVARVLKGEATVRLQDLPLVEAGRRPAGLFAMSLSACRAQGPQAAGILAVFHAATPWRQVDRLQGFLLALNEALSGLHVPADVVAAGCEMLGLSLGLDRAGFAVLDADETAGTVWPEWSAGGAGSLARRFRLADAGEAAAGALRAGRTVFGSASGADDADPWDGQHAAVQVPVLQDGRLAAVVRVKSPKPRRWSDGDVETLRRAGSLIHGAFTHARLAAVLDESRERLRAMVEGLPALVWRAAPDGRWTWSSPQWTGFTGLSPELSLGEGWLAAFHPDDRDAMREAWGAAKRDDGLVAEARIRHGLDGRYAWFQTRAVPVRDSHGGLTEWLGTCTDTNDLHRLRDRQAQLLEEFSHRARRTIAVLRSLARRSAEDSATVSDYAMLLDGRIDAFSRAQAIVSGDPEGEVDLDYLVAEELGAHGAHEDGVIRIEGPPVRLRLAAAQAIGLAVHELVTHAVGHGALLGNNGSIRIGWRIGDNEAGRELSFEWEEESTGESEGAAAPQPRFSLLEKMLADEMNARTFITAWPGGFRCRIALPLTDGLSAP